MKHNVIYHMKMFQINSFAYYIKDLKANELFYHKGLYLKYTYYLHTCYPNIYNIFFFLDKQLRLFSVKWG